MALEWLYIHILSKYDKLRKHAEIMKLKNTYIQFNISKKVNLQIKFIYIATISAQAANAQINKY